MSATAPRNPRAAYGAIKEGPLSATETEPVAIEGIIISQTLEGGRLVSITRPDPIKAFIDPAFVDALLARIQIEAVDFKPDLATKKGRAEIASRAYKVSQTKTYIEGIGKAVVDELKAMPTAVDVGRKTYRDGLDALRDLVRKPLDDFEAEQARLKTSTEALESRPMNFMDRTVAEYDEKIAGLQAMVIDKSWGDYQARAETARENAIANFIDLRSRRATHDLEMIELAQLREAKEAQAKIDAENKIREEAAEKALQGQKDALAKAEQGKKDAERRAAEADDRAELERKDAEARAEKARLDGIAAEKLRQQESEARERIANEARAQDVENRRRINNEVLVDLQSLETADISEEMAKAIVIAIASKQIRNVSIAY